MTDSARRQRLARHWRDDLPFGLPSNFNFDVIRTKRDVGSMMAALPNADRGIGRTQAVRAARSHRPGSVRVAAGDTKVLRRGEGGGLYLATTGIGVRRPGLRLGLDQIRDSDVVMVSGPVGDHGTAVLLAREDFGLKGDLASDAASILPLAQALWDLPGLRFMRDPTRGGLVTVMHDIARMTEMTVRLEETAIPVHPPVRAVCDMLGYDPLYLACEGRVVAVLSAEDAPCALDIWRTLPGGEAAAIIGRLNGSISQVILQTEIGGERLLEELEDDPLPRIC